MDSNRRFRTTIVDADPKDKSGDVLQLTKTEKNANSGVEVKSNGIEMSYLSKNISANSVTTPEVESTGKVDPNGTTVKTRRPSTLLQAPISPANRNHYTPIRAHLLKSMGASDWGSEVSDDVTMTDTFSMDSLYTVEKVVALFDTHQYSREISGFLNRLNFSVNNYENLRVQNARVLGPKVLHLLPQMHKVFPVGGFQNSGKVGFDMKGTQWENLIANYSGWALAVAPLMCLVVAATSNLFLLHFTCCYLLLSLTIISATMLAVDLRNKQTLTRCKMCIPVPVTSENLKGFRNYFTDLTQEGVRNVKALKKLDRDFFTSILQKEEETTGHCVKTIRVMFYSVEYYQKFIQVPRYKLYGLLLLDIVLLLICAVFTVRKTAHVL